MAVEDRQQGAGADAGGVAEPAQFRSGRRGVAKDHCEQHVDGRQADTDGLACGGELGLFILVNNHCGGKATLQLHASGAHVGQLLAHAGKFLLVGTGIKGADDTVRFTVEGLTGDATAASVPGNGTLGAEEDGGSAGNLRNGSYDEHGG
jgi:hypothetical protein